MSGFSFDPSGPPMFAAFNRLISAKVGDGTSKQDTGEVPQARQIFNEFNGSASAIESQQAPSEPIALQGLESAVDNLSESSTVLGFIASPAEEVQRAISDASEASVQDVSAAADLAAELYARIRENERMARQAHEGKLSRESVQRFLS